MCSKDTATCRQAPLHSFLWTLPRINLLTMYQGVLMCCMWEGGGEANDRDKQILTLVIINKGQLVAVGEMGQVEAGINSVSK
jgi:hypothetical protein